MQYEGRRQQTHAAKRLTAAAAAAEASLQAVLLAGTMYESGALPGNVHSAPTALLEALRSRGLLVRSPRCLLCTHAMLASPPVCSRRGFAVASILSAADASMPSAAVTPFPAV